MLFAPRSAATAWLGVAIFSMIFMGVYAFLIALARTPVIGPALGDPSFFKTALVTHVVLALVIWFLAFILFLSHLATPHVPARRGEFYLPLLALAGIGLIVITPFTGPAHPILNNYIPILDRPLYLAGLALFFLAALVASLLRAPALIRDGKKEGAPPFLVTGALALATMALLSSIICVALAGAAHATGPHQGDYEPQFFYEMLFWGGGHTLQFANTLGLMAAWAYLYWRIAGQGLVGEKMSRGILGVTLLFIVMAPFFYLFYEYDSAEFRSAVTLFKGVGLSFGPIILALALLRNRERMGEATVVRRGIWGSVFLFGVGGAIALTLEGSDTRIPGHYHSAIGGVTLAFMAVGLHVTTANGWLLVSEKWQRIQLTLYPVGQAILVAGFFVGGYAGLQRKTFSTDQTIDSLLKKLGASFMGTGNLFAVIAGVMFVVFMLIAFKNGLAISRERKS